METGLSPTLTHHCWPGASLGLLKTYSHSLFPTYIFNLGWGALTPYKRSMEAASSCLPLGVQVPCDPCRTLFEVQVWLLTVG